MLWFVSLQALAPAGCLVHCGSCGPLPLCSKTGLHSLMGDAMELGGDGELGGMGRFLVKI